MGEDEIQGFYEGFGALVRVSRAAAGLTQDELGARVGLTRSSVANVESGRQRPPLHVLVSVAQALGVNPCDLLPGRAAPTTGQVPDMPGEVQEARDFVRAILSSAGSARG